MPVLWRKLATKGPTTDFLALAQQIPKSYQRMAANSAAELNRLLAIDEAGRVRGRTSGGESAIAADQLLSFLATKRKSTIRWETL